MYALYAVGSLVRVFTTIVDAKDFIMLANFLVSVTINSTIVCQVIYYWKRTINMYTALPQNYRDDVEKVSIKVKSEDATLKGV